MIVIGSVKAMNLGKKLMSVFFADKSQTAKLQEKEAKISKHLPFAYLEEDGLIRTKDGDYLAILKIAGISWDTLEDDELNFQQILRAQLFSTLSDPRFAIYHTIIRNRVQPFLEGDYHSPIAREINVAYQKTISDNPLFHNDLYISILFKRNSRLKQWFSGVSHRLNQKQAEIARQEAIKALNTVTFDFSLR